MSHCYIDDCHHVAVKSEPQDDDVDLEDGSFDMIDLFREHPCLYNTNLRDYRDKEKKAAAIADIAARVGRSENAVRKKIKVLRTIYTRYKKEKILRNGEAPCWKNAERLSFLDQFSTPRLDLVDAMTDEFAVDNFVDENPEEDGMTVDWLAAEGDDELRVMSVHNSNSSSKRARYMSPSSGGGSGVGGSSWVSQPSPSGRQCITSVEQKDLSVCPSSLDDTNRYHTDNTLPYLPTFTLSTDSNATVKAAAGGKLSRQSPSAAVASNSSTSFSSNNKTASVTSCDEDADDVFGKYIGLELKTITDINAKRLAKLRIQTILYEAQTGISAVK